MRGLTDPRIWGGRPEDLLPVDLDDRPLRAPATWWLRARLRAAALLIAAARRLAPPSTHP